jgi:hypothetical protein
MPLADNLRPDPYRPPTMDEIHRGRDMYTQGFTVSRILAATDMSLGTFYSWLDGGPCDEKGEPMLPPIPRRRQVLGKRRKPLIASHASLVARLYRTAERQALDIERRLACPSDSTPERERDVRMLALLVQSLRGLSAVAPAEPKGASASRKIDEPDDPVPEDIDEYRLELARRIRAFIASREAQTAVAEEKSAG